MALRRKQRRQTIDDTDDKDWMPAKPVIIDFDDPFKTNYSQEENNRTYKLFSLMDIDNSGTISLREIKRVLMGSDIIRTFAESFLSADTGISFKLDEDDCVCIDEIEPGSPAFGKLTLVTGLRVLRVNQQLVPKCDKNSLQIVFRELMRSQDREVEFEFLEPIIIINKS